jgi:hypothetical protein
MNINEDGTSMIAIIETGLLRPNDGFAMTELENRYQRLDKNIGRVV